MALWFSREISATEGNTTQEILLEDVADRVKEGGDLAGAIKGVTGHDPRAGDFGIEVLGSLVAMALIEGLKVFWAAYIKELEEKAGKSLANATLDYIKSLFKKDAIGPSASEIQAKMKGAIKDAAAKLNVDPAALDAALGAIGPTVAAAGASGN